MREIRAWPAYIPLNAMLLHDRIQSPVLGARFVLAAAMLLAGGWAIGHLCVSTARCSRDDAVARLQTALLQGDEAAFDAACSGPSSLTPSDFEEALRLAAIYGKDSSFSRLLAEGVDPDATDDRGNTALMLLAICPDNLLMARQLLDAGADVNAADNRGRTALMKAVVIGRAEMVRFLLDHGARVQAIDQDGESALSEALRSDDAALIRLIDQSIEKSRAGAKSDLGKRIG